MAIQLRNLLEKSLQVKLSVATFWSHPSIHEYATFLSHTLAEQLLIKKMEVTASPVKKTSPSDWFITPQPNPEAALRIFCFHDAGGNASLYQTWETMLGKNIELVSIELPGRGRRLDETPYTDVQSLVRDIKPALTALLDKPFIFFGHSMGGLVAFEIARALQASGLPVPTKLFVSSTPGLTTYTNREVDETLSEEDLITMFPHLDNANIGDRELQQLLINLLRSDLKLLNNYSYTTQQKLEIPIVAIHGTEDERVKREQAERWNDETISYCKVISRPGGHRYIEHDASFLTALLQEEVSVPVIIR
jgi:surfactin synthase thioesterase subunit